MRRKKQVLLLGASTLALTAFSFTAGYGLRELAVLARGGEARWVFTGSPGAPRRPGRLFASRNGPTATDRDLGAGQVFYEVLGQLQEQYVEKLPGDTVLASGALNAMLDSLRDPNSRLIEPEEAAAIRGMSNGVYPGLGAVLTVRLFPRSDGSRERNITVVAPMPGSPAEKAGLLPGDRITEVDGHWIAPTRLSPRVLNRLTEDDGLLFDPARMNLPQEEEDRTRPSVDELRKRRETVDVERKKWRNSTDLPTVLRQLTIGTSGKVALTIERTGETKPITREVVMARTEVPAVTSRVLNDNVGYVRLAQVNHAAVSSFSTAVADLQKRGARSLVLDLRRNPGGSIGDVQEIASRLLPSGTVALLQRRNSERKLVKQPLGVKSDVKHARFQNLAVLVDGGTAGSAEILAAALRDTGGAKLVGAQTFGDGTEQTLFPLDNGAALILTTAKMLAPKEGDFDGKGLKPDVAATAAPGADRPLEQALRALRPS